jgi:hypothetical protein
MRESINLQAFGTGAGAETVGHSLFLEAPCVHTQGVLGAQGPNVGNGDGGNAELRLAKVHCTRNVIVRAVAPYVRDRP